MKKESLFGIDISVTDYNSSVASIIKFAKSNQPAIVTALAVHGLMTANKDKGYAKIINAFDIVTPDGQPIRWALNSIYDSKMTDRVYGPKLMIETCKAAEKNSIAIYLYGSTKEVIDSLNFSLKNLFPKLNIVGAKPSAFRPLTVEEDLELVNEINATGAKIIFIGLGCPLQEKFAFEHKEKIKGVQICVGAAFDFHAGNKKMAPQWMQDNGLEWFYRLSQEPNRLWKRYLTTNSQFVFEFMKEKYLHRSHK